MLFESESDYHKRAEMWLHMKDVKVTYPAVLMRKAGKITLPFI